MQVTATAIVQKQNMVNGTNNLYPKNAVDIVHEETNLKVPIVKRKTKQSNKSKDIPDRFSAIRNFLAGASFLGVTLLIISC
jgi:hypothetical protein